MFARKLMFPFLLAAIILLVLSWRVDERYIIWLLLPVGISAVLYMLSPQIDWWWYNRHPPPLPSPVIRLFEGYCPFYRQLDEADRLRFRQRVALYQMGVEFIPMVFEQVPEDIKSVLAAQAVQLTFHEDSFLIEKFERIVVYPHPFPSPQYPDLFHASELYAPDGVLLFSADEVMKGFLAPRKFYPVALHEYARAFLLTHPERSLPSLPDDLWNALEDISGLTHEKMEKDIGLGPVDPLAACIVHYFCFPEAFQQRLPEWSLHLQDLFRKK